MTDVLKDIHYMLAEIFIHYDGLGLSMYDYTEYKTMKMLKEYKTKIKDKKKWRF